MASAYVDLTTTFVYKMVDPWGKHDALAENDRYIKENGWQDSCVVPFFQSAAPTGWTKGTSQNDKMLRVVSGTGGGSGGSTATSATVTRAHTHSISNQAAHTHNTDGFHTHSHVTTTDTAGTGSTGVKGAASAQGTWDSGGATPFTAWAPGWGADDGTGVLTSAGAHDHGGVTASALSNWAIAYIDIIFCTKDTSSGYTDLTTTFMHNLREVYDYLSQLAGNDAFSYARLTPATSVSIFYQASAPTGWTKLTTQNDKALRIVSGTGGGTGGTDAFSSDLSPTHSHSNLTSAGTHSHPYPTHRHSINQTNAGVTLGGTPGGYVSDDGSGFIRRRDGTAVSATVLESRTAADGSGTASTDPDHTHTVNSTTLSSTFAYVDVIQCSKNSTGAPQSYSDYTSFFVDQALLAYQDLQQLAYNDAYQKYHLVPATSVMFFWQAAAPSGWTKLTTQNDKGLRIVSGSGGSAGGGSLGISQTIILAHTHVIGTYGHSHTFSHSHAWGSSTQANAGNLTAAFRLYYNSFQPNLQWADPTSTSGPDQKVNSSGTSTDTGFSTQFNHSHGGTTGSALTNVTMAYVDMIMCSKN